MASLAVSASKCLTGYSQGITRAVASQGSAREYPQLPKLTHVVGGKTHFLQTVGQMPQFLVGYWPEASPSFEAGDRWAPG